MSDPNDTTDREKEIFNKAIELLTPEARARFLEGACGTDERLHQRIQVLLAAYEDAAGFIPTKEGDATVLSATPLSEGPGTKIGRYKLLQQIGEGGMGVVYMAEQEEPVRRRVALKVIKLGMDTKQVVARFEAERQALALMDHPNIARVLDGGATDTGRPYFVMELVQGVPITEFCDKAKLSAKERLQLFIQVCQAVQSAHQKGIIHRDIKPSNVLVTLHDGVPVPKVIDFGVAKATNQKLTERTLFTNFATMIGTPAYMSPEQAEMSGLDIDTRTDIYALGVLLYALLTGTTPFPEKRLRSLGYGEMQRVILEEEPERPSTRLGTMADEQKTIVARNCGEELASLSNLLRGDLDWIVMKCLEKNRQRRYETASGLASDIQRHLSNEPVVARPPSPSYRFQKMVRRNKTVFVAAGAVVLALVAGISVATWQAFRARMAEREAAVERNRAVEERDRARRAEEEAKTERSKAMAERQLAEQAKANEAQLRIKAEIEALVAELSVYMFGAELDKFATAQMPASVRASYFAQKTKNWREALGKATAGLEKYSNDERLRFQVTQIQGALASACFEAGEIAEARDVARQWLASNTDTKSWDYGNVIHKGNILLGRAAMHEGNLKEAGEYLLKAGHAPGSPQLNSFGPDFALAAELLAAGEKSVVLEYLDLVEMFWTQKASLEKWREDIRAGRTPQAPAWVPELRRRYP